MSGRMSGKPTTALIEQVMHASKKELRRMVISFITSEPTQLEYEPIEEVKAQRPDVDNAHVIAAEMSRKLTKEELTATPMNDLRIVSEIKEKFPERLTGHIEKYFGDERFERTALSGVYVRLKDIENIIYGEGDEK